MKKEDLKKEIVKANLTGKIERVLLKLVDNVKMQGENTNNVKKLTLKEVYKSKQNFLTWNNLKAVSYEVFILQEGKPYSVKEIKGLQFNFDKYKGNVRFAYVVAKFKDGNTKKSNVLNVEIKPS